MSEDNTAPAPGENIEPVEDISNDKGSEVDPQAEVEKYKTLAAKWEARSKDNFGKAKNFDELNEKFTQLESTLNQFQEENIAPKRQTVAARYNLPEAIASRLTGSTEAEFEADAKSLVEALKLTGVKQERITPTPLKTQGIPADGEITSSGKHKTKQEYLAWLKANKTN